MKNSPSQLAFLLGEFPQAVLVGVPQNILAAAVLYHLEVGKQIDHIPQPPLVQFRASKVFGQNVLQLLVLLLNGAHGVIDYLSDLRGVGGGGNDLPSGGFGYEEDVL